MSTNSRIALLIVSKIVLNYLKTEKTDDVVVVVAGCKSVHLQCTRELTVHAQIIIIKWQLLKCACITYLYWFPSQHCSITITKCKNNECKRHKIPAKFFKVDLDPDCTKIKIQ